MTNTSEKYEGTQQGNLLGGRREEAAGGRAARLALTAEESGESSGRGRSLTEIGNRLIHKTGRDC